MAAKNTGSASDNKKNTIKNYAQARAALQTQKIHNLYLFFGEEDYLIEKLVKQVQDLALNPQSKDLDRVVFDIDGDPGKLDLEKLENEIRTPPFLSLKKIVLIKNSGLFLLRKRKGSKDNNTSNKNSDAPAGASIKEKQEQMIEMLKKLNDSVCLVFVEEAIDKRLKRLLDAAHKAGIIAELPLGKSSDLKKVIVHECQKLNIGISKKAVESLLRRSGPSLRVIRSELDKIFLYLDYCNLSEITEDVIDFLCLPDLQGKVFDLTDAIARLDVSRALDLLDVLLKQRQPIQLIWFMFARHFRQLICAAELKNSQALITQLKVMPFVAARLVQQASRFEMLILEEIYTLCFEGDLMVKTGKISDRLMLETLIIKAGALGKK